MDPKTFSVTRADRPGIHVTGFAESELKPFIIVRIGDTSHTGEFSVLLNIADAIALSLSLSDAITHADPAAAEAAALGRLAEVTR